MMPIGGVPVLEREILNLKGQGFTDILLTINDKQRIMMHHFGNGRRLGVHIDYYVEKEPLGNAGALFMFRDKLKDDFFLLNADSAFDIDFNRMLEFHKQHGKKVTLFAHPNNHPYDSGILIPDEDGTVKRWLTKEETDRPEFYQNIVNAGIHIISPLILDESGIDSALIGKDINGAPFKVDLDRDLLKPLAGKYELQIYKSPEYVKDMGTPKRYYAVNEDFKKGIITKRNLQNKQQAVFLDRDGVINRYVGFLTNPDNFELLPGVEEAISKLNRLGVLVIVVTNQPVVARGDVTFEGLREIHNKMETLLGKRGAYIDGLYFCPHHPDKGFPGEVAELKIDCDCRKPKPGMLLKAAEDFNIDLESSWMVGDSKNDILAGKRAGCKTAYIGSSLNDFGQTITVRSLMEFVSSKFRYE